MLLHDFMVILGVIVFYSILFVILKKISGSKLDSRAIFIIFFLSLIYAPFIQEKTQLLQYPLIEENRKKAPLPKGNLFIELLNDHLQYSKSYEKYFNDNYGLRDPFIRLKNQIDYTFFKVSDEVLIGKENWLFYKSVVEREQVYIEQQSDTQYQKIQDKILYLNQYFNKRGVLFVVVPVPMKNSVYRDYFINHTVIRPSPTKFEKFVSFLKAHPEIKYVDAPDILEKNKDQYLVYHKTDFHWTDIGAYLVSKEIISHVGGWMKQPTPWIYPLQTQINTNFVGGQTNSLATILFPGEDSLILNNSPKSPIPDPNTPKPFLYYFKSSAKPGTKLLPKALFIGNSYLLNLLNTGIFDHFNEVLAIHSNDMKEIPGSIPKDVKIVVFELLEIDLLKNYIFE